MTYWYAKFRENLPTTDENLILSGNIQMDEAYFGHFNKKYCLLIAKQTKTSISSGKLIPRLLPQGKDPNKTDIMKFLKDYVVRPSGRNPSLFYHK